MITKSIFQFIISCLFVLTGLISYGQTGESSTFRFVPYENQLFGFDANLISEWKESYDITLITGLNEYPVAYKSVVQGYTDSVDIVIPDEINYSNLSFVVEDSTYQLECFKRTKDTFTIVLPIINSNYSLDVFAGDKLLGSIRIVVYPEHVVNVVIVPLIRFKANSDSLETYLNRVYQQAGLAISLEVDPFFTTGSFSDSVLWNPRASRWESNSLLCISNQWLC